MAEVATRCECAVVDQERLAGVTIAPQARLSIPGRVEVRRKTGASQQDIRLALSDGRSFTCRVRWTVKPTYTTSPPEVRFHVIDEEAPRAQRVFFQPAPSVGVRLVSQPASDSPWLSATRDGNIISIGVSPRAAPAGRSRGRVALLTDDPHVSLLTVPVSLHKLGRLNPFPARVRLAPGGSRSVWVTDAAGEFAEVSGVCGDARIRITAGGAGRLEIRCAAGAGGGPFAAVVRVRGADGAECEISVEVEGGREGAD